MTAGLQAAEIRKLHRAGVGKAEIARRLQIGRTSVRRILARPIPELQVFLPGIGHRISCAGSGRTEPEQREKDC